MNNTDSHQPQEFVPEVDPASLQGVALPPPSSEAMPLGCSPTLPDDPAEAMQQLPPSLSAHIQDLLAQADAEGYLRGRNEVIESTQHFDDSDDECHLIQAPIPCYDRHTIWDL